MTAAATTRLPQPLALDGVVYSDVSTRTLFVRLPDAAGGHARSLWGQAYQQLRKAEESGRAASVPTLWASGAGKTSIAHGVPGEAGTLKFHFYPGKDSAYSELVGKPGLFAYVTIDRSTGQFLGVTFRNRL